jgi:asparagine synthase (glutamine-hydrolysing)
LFYWNNLQNDENKDRGFEFRIPQTMSGFTGWVGVSDQKHSTSTISEQMGPLLTGAASVPAKMCANNRNGLLSCGTTSWVETPDVWAAIDGSPRWLDPDLAAIARSDGNAAALLSAYRQQGKDLLKNVGGDFALAVVEADENRGLFAIDRSGIKTLCISEKITDVLVFGTTADGVRGFPGVGSQLSVQSIYDFFYFIDRIPAPQTVYDHQSKLLPGEYIYFDKGNITRDYYWKMPTVADPTRTIDDLSTELMDRLRTAVTRQVNGYAADKIGAFLSGGLDSSTVVGLLAEVTQQSPKTFTIGFDIDAFDETEYANMAVQHFGTTHQEYRVTPADVFDSIPKIAAIYDEPFGNASAVPVYFCAKIAKEAGVDVMMAGDGGDELFAGNSRYVEDQVFDRYEAIPKPLRRFLLEPLLNALPEWASVSLIRRAQNYSRIANMSVAARTTRGHIYADIPPTDIFTDSALAEIDLLQPHRFLEELYESIHSDSSLRRILNLDLRITLADSDLRKVNRMCEIAGTSVHYPFLDDDLLEFSARIPDEIMLKDGQLRSFYKYAFRDFLPKEILAKKKHGFGLPFVDFTRRHPQLQAYVYDSVTALKKRRYFKDDFLDTAISNHREGLNTPLSNIVWDLMMLELWFQNHVEAAA